jgi:hypothetical protein
MSNEPQKIDEQNWYYEERRGVCLVHEVWIEGRHVRTDQVYIPWRLLRATMKRAPKPRTPKAVKP